MEINLVMIYSFFPNLEGLSRIILPETMFITNVTRQSS